MNQKDYKAIGKIIKDSIYETIGGEFVSKERLVKDLADYFEEKDTCKLCGFGRNEHIAKLILSCAGMGKEFQSKFNREQFLKDCGIEKTPKR